MGKRFCILMVLLLLLCGCDSHGTDREKSPAENTLPAATTEATEATVPVTVPADGDPGDVTCQGSYTDGSGDPKAVVAQMEPYTLTNEQLQVWYRLEVASWQQGNNEVSPDFSRPLDTQVCELDSSVNSWQQFFLKRALNTWHSVCALAAEAQVRPIPTEEAYQPNLDNYAEYMTGMPATELLYGYDPLFQPNSMHDAYLTALPQTLDALAKEKGYADLQDMAAAFGTTAEVLTEAVRLYNFSYMYLTELGYSVEVSEETVLAHMESAGGYDQTGRAVDIRHILLVPQDGTVAPDGTVTCAQESWDACMAEAEELLAAWAKDRRCSGATFSELAVVHSRDTGTAANGGNYRGVVQGQLMPVLDDWCFDPARQSGDTTIVQSNYGVHLLYFTGAADRSFLQARADLTAQALGDRLSGARAQYPATIDYDAISLVPGDVAVTLSDILYPDIAHERFPEVPLYLQQDYPSTKYGAYWIRTNGCGITTLAMLASYMADDELTPPEMCARYGNYSHKNGTDGMIFNYEPAVMGFYLREKTYDHAKAKAALEEGQIVISVQHKGYWTRGGHYIVLEHMDENGLIQVRDSNIYNYSRIRAHVDDRHTWGSITASGDGFWIYEDKITHIDACSRCGTPEQQTPGMLTADYICEKCAPALLRRNAYLAFCGMDV